MSQYNRPKPLIVVFFILLILIIILIGLNASMSSNSTIQERISYGEKTLFPDLDIKNKEYTQNKKEGIESIKDENWKKAINDLKSSLGTNNKCPEKLSNKTKPLINDPEALIYLNNAKIEYVKEKSYTIAVSIPISKNPNSSLEILRGVAQAQNEINCLPTKIKGLPLKVAIASDDDDEKVAQEVAEALVGNHSILGVIGHSASATTLATRKIYNSKKLVAITPISTSVEISKLAKKSDNYVFRTVPSDQLAAQKLATYMLKTLPNKKVAVFSTKGNYSQSLKKEFESYVSKAGGQVLDDKLFDLSNPNFSPTSSLKHAEEQGVQVLMLGPDNNTLTEVLLVIKENNKKLNLLGGDVVYTPKILKEGGDGIVGMVVAIPWHIDSDTKSKSAEEFTKKSQELWGAKVSWRTALAYDATQALIAAIKHEPNRSGVQKALSSNKLMINGASGTVQFLPSGDRKNAPVQLVQIIRSNGTPSKYEFQPITE